MLRLTELTRGAGPVVATVLAVLLIIVGILVILYPALVPWLVGIGLVLVGVAVLASLFIPSDRIDS